MAEIKIFIGPNGYGKTYKLNEIRDELIGSNTASESDILFLDSEITLLDEVKDTVDNSKTMEFILFELLETPNYLAKKAELEKEVDMLIANNQAMMNQLVDEILCINNSQRTTDFIKPTKPEKKKYKGQVTIDTKDIKKSMGSGQRMQLLLSLVKNSTKTYIFLDEPEKYSHPSMLHKTANIINELSAAGKSIYLATHSPKLLSMIDFEFDSLYIINDNTHQSKQLNLDAVAGLQSRLPVNNYPKVSQDYYASKQKLASVLKRRHFREFLEALFAQRVFVCEGINDSIYITESLHRYFHYFEDYHILKTYGKFNIPAIASLLQAVDIDTVVFFDKDDESQPKHKRTNDFLRTSFPAVLEMDPCLESKVGYTDQKNDTMSFFDHVEDQLTHIEDVWI